MKLDKQKLKDGRFIICDKCNGKGGYKIATRNHINVQGSFVKNEVIPTTYEASWTTCNKCLGEGKLDWIEAIVGKNDNVIPIHADVLDLTKMFKKSAAKRMSKDIDDRILKSIGLSKEMLEGTPSNKTKKEIIF